MGYLFMGHKIPGSTLEHYGGLNRFPCDEQHMNVTNIAQLILLSKITGNVNSPSHN